ncbi:Holliday junction branch migration DNA helicase RuvB [Candidatus Saccharibacteria bacterium]|nr:Holliday junction branch migration DNA helicase RuvB [Candidatus Saccharibacteria bacterium]
MGIERSTKRVVDVKSEPEDVEEQVFEKSLRPTSFAEYIGQERLKTNLKLAIDAVKKRDDGTTLDHVLLYGPPGLGKTTMANVIAHELNANLKITSGPAIERAGDLASILTNLQDGDVLFIDEIHRLRRVVEEILYSAMEDYKLDIVIGKGPAARSVRLDLPHFTVIGATTRTGSLAGPLRDRFGIIHRLEYYQLPEIQQIVARTAEILGKKIEPEATELLATRCRLTPRIANRLVKRVRDYADVNGDGIIDVKLARDALNLMEIDEFGLDPADRNMLELMIENYGDRPVGLSTIAALTGDEATTIEEYYEPYLLQLGLLERTPKGRVVTVKAREHLKNLKEKK